MNKNKQFREDFFVERPQFDFRQQLSKMVANWYWFVISVVICVLVSFCYIRYATPIFRTQSKVLITEDKAPNPADDVMSKAFGSQFGLGNGGEAEAEIFRTRHLMQKVVREMKSYITYYHQGSIRKTELYHKAPFKLTLLSSPDSIIAQTMNVTLHGNKVSITGEVGYTGEEYTRNVNLYQQFDVPGLGKILIERGFDKPEPDQVYTVEIATVKDAVLRYMKRLEVSIPIVMVKILSLDFTGEVPEKSEDVLNKLTEVYVESTRNDKNRIADSTIAFIDNRLLYVGQELASVEGDVQSFKQRNKITDLSAQATQLISSTKESVEELSKTETQLSVLNSIEEYLSRADATERIVPSGALVEDQSFAALIERYNTIVIEKEKSSLTQTEDNPYIKNLNTQIASARVDMLSGIGGLKRSLEITRQRIKSRSSNIAGQVQKVPAAERTYLDLSRQQQIKQELYVFLLQKREETAISKTSNISNCRVIEPPVSAGPISPMKANVYGYGFILGMLIPFGLILFNDKFNNRIMSRAQITEHTQVPIISEIGHSAESGQTIVVGQDSRSPISEQFRALRTNLAFFLNGKEKTILLTSSMSGEGKSFISLNLATVLALSGKKVLVMEMDLRRPNLSNKLNIKNDFGFTNYIVSKDMLPEQVIVPSGTHDNLFIISSGNIPPNPTEIIMNDRTDLLMTYLSEHFDYVIVDAPPVGMVTDAQLLSKYADLSLYVIRQRYTMKEQLVIPQDIYVNGKMKNIALLVNDVKSSDSYGYGYGMGYSYGEPAMKYGFFKRIFKKK